MSVPANSITVTALSLINGAAQEIGALASGESLPADDQAWVLLKLQRLIDTYNAKRTMIFNVGFTQFTLLANHSPHLIGPTGDFAVNQRPVEIPSIGLQLLSSTPLVEFPLTMRDQDWWANQAVKNLTSTLPTDFYYSADWPNGSIYFWPIPTQVNKVLIQSRTVISEVATYASSFSMPPGYWNLIIYELAIEIAPSFVRPVGPDLRERYQRALNAVTTNNISSPRGSTLDAGMPGGNRGGGFNYYTGGPSKN